jgi:hypothetical protein
VGQDARKRLRHPPCVCNLSGKFGGAGFSNAPGGAGWNMSETCECEFRGVAS